MGRRLRVLSVAYPFAPVGADAVGGAEQVLSAIDAALVTAGYRSTVIACAGSQTSGELVPIAACIENRAGTHCAVRAAIAERIGDVDLIHLHGIDFSDYLPPPGPSVLATLHLPPAWYPAEMFAPARPRIWVHGVSASQHADCPASPALLPPIANGVPVEALGAPHRRCGYALTLGRICPEKGQHLALDAAHAAGVTLLVAGEAFAYPAHRDYLEREIRPRLDRRRRWIGPVGFARKRRLLNAARCVLIPSLCAETSSLVAMEAAACGTPVIAFDVGALPETVRHGVTGFIVRDVAGMAAAVAHVGDIDPEDCRAHARAQFDVSRMTDAYLARYRELA